MSYIKETESQLRKLLAEAESEDEIIKFVNDKVLESYRNGMSVKENKSGKKSKRFVWGNKKTEGN